MPGRPARRCRRSCKCPDGSGLRRPAPHAGTVRVPAAVAPVLRGGVSVLTRAQAGYREPCTRRPSRRRRVAPEYDSAKWSDQSSAGKISREQQFRLQRWIVGTRFLERFSSFRLGWFRRSNQTQNSRAFPEVIRCRQGLLLKRNVLVTQCTNKRCVSPAIRLSEHIAAHDTPATYRNPHRGSIIQSHEPPRRKRMRAI